MSTKKKGKHGGRRQGAGRPPGSRNKATLAREAGAKTLTDLARENTEAALAALLEVAGDATAPAAARVTAATALLDRAWGRPPQHGPLHGRFEQRKESPSIFDKIEENILKNLSQGN